MKLFASHGFINSKNYLSSTLYFTAWQSLPNNEYWFVQAKAGARRRRQLADAFASPMQMACQHEVLTQMKLSCADDC